jgi:hypothetical protein
MFRNFYSRQKNFRKHVPEFLFKEKYGIFGGRKETWVGKRIFLKIINLSKGLDLENLRKTRSKVFIRR